MLLVALRRFVINPAAPYSPTGTVPGRLAGESRALGVLLGAVRLGAAPWAALRFYWSGRAAWALLLEGTPGRALVLLAIAGAVWTVHRAEVDGAWRTAWGAAR